MAARFAASFWIASDAAIASTASTWASSSLPTMNKA
jgi:hypothetical protein